MKKCIVIWLFISLGISQGSSLDSYLRSELKEYKSFTYKIVSLPAGIDSYSDTKIEIDLLRKFRLNKGFAYIPVKVKTNKNASSNSFITVKLQLFADVWVANRKIKKNEKLSLDEFKLVQKDISKLYYYPSEKNTCFSNYRARKTISKGSIVKKNMLEKIPIVYRGDNLNAYSAFGNVIIHCAVTSKSDGSKDDIIRVVRNDKKLFKARVIDKNTVKIVE